MNAMPGTGSRTDPRIVHWRRRITAIVAGMMLSSLPHPAVAADGQLATKQLQKAAVACQKVIAAVSAKVLATKFKTLDACANAALVCVQTKQAKGDCLAKAGQTCAKQLHKATAALTKAQGKIVTAKSCATELRLPDLLSADGLGLGQVAGQCQNDFGLDICAGLDPLAACLVRTHDGAAGALYGDARPRTGELLTLLPDVILPPVDGLPVFTGCEQCSVEVANQKPIEQCGRALTKTTQTLVAKLDGTYRACAQKVLACVQTKADAAVCLAKAQAGCDKGATTIAKAVGKFATAVAKKCGPSAVDFAQLASAAGLNLDALAQSCSSLGASAPTSAETLAACLTQRAVCTTSGLVQQSVARVAEFEEQNELGTLGNDLTATCLPMAAPASVKTIQGARFNFGILKFLKQVRLPFGGIVKVPTTGGRPLSSPGAGRGVTTIHGPTRVSFGAIVKIPFTYHLSRARSLQSGLEASPPMLIVTVQRDDVTLDDHFEIALDPALTEDQLEVAYQDTLPGCAFTLALAIRDDGVVSDYTPLLQVVERFLDNGDGTVTDTQTGLQWEKKTTAVGSGSNYADPHDVDNTYTWTASGTPYPPDGTAFTDFLVKLNTPPCFAGHCDWRLPSEYGRNSPFTGAKELESILLAPAPCGTSPCIDPIFGPTADVYWSATPYTGANLLFAWLVNFNHDSFDLDVDNDPKESDYHVRAVRGGRRFVDSGDGTVTDTQTGLQWEKKTTAVGSGSNYADPHDVDNTYTWTASGTPYPPDGTAFTDFLVKLNTPPCFAGHCDWRLPSEYGLAAPFPGANELASILLAPYPCASPCIDPIFGPTASIYWSATTVFFDPTLALLVVFDTGTAGNAYKITSESVRAVRTGP